MKPAFPRQPPGIQHGPLRVLTPPRSNLGRAPRIFFVDERTGSAIQNRFSLAPAFFTVSRSHWLRVDFFLRAAAFLLFPFAKDFEGFLVVGRLSCSTCVPAQCPLLSSGPLQTKCPSCMVRLFAQMMSPPPKAFWKCYNRVLFPFLCGSLHEDPPFAGEDTRTHGDDFPHFLLPTSPPSKSPPFAIVLQTPPGVYPPP